jgi:beta-lactam-binding protein with PASTA domain
MPSLFHFSPVPPRVSLNAQRKGEASFTVSNASGKPIRGRARVRPQSPAQEAWFILTEERERDFDATSTAQYTVQIDVPGDVPAGTYTFRLDVMEVEEPEENYTEGPTVTFELRAAPPPSRPFPWWILAVVGGVVVLAVVLAIILWPRKVTVPDVELMTLAQAEAEISEAGLVASTTTEAHDTIEEGQVIRSNPPASSKVDKGSTVMLIISSGVGQVTVPSVDGMTEAQATTALEAQGLEVTIERENSGTIEKGQAMRTEPSADSNAVPGSTVKLVVSLGVGEVTIPPVAGITSAQAIIILEELGLKAAVSSESHNTVEKDKVIRTEPSASKKVEKGSTVTLVVSTGPVTVIVPDVTDRKEADAKQILENACEPSPCFVVEIQRQSSNSVDEGRVIRTSPETNTEAPRGSSVTMVVSSGPAGTRIIVTRLVPSLSSKTTLSPVAQLSGNLSSAGCSPSPVRAGIAPAGNGIRGVVSFDISKLNNATAIQSATVRRTGRVLGPVRLSGHL